MLSATTNGPTLCEQQNQSPYIYEIYFSSIRQKKNISNTITIMDFVALNVCLILDIVAAIVYNWIRHANAILYMLCCETMSIKKKKKPIKTRRTNPRIVQWKQIQKIANNAVKWKIYKTYWNVQTVRSTPNYRHRS